MMRCQGPAVAEKSRARKPLRPSLQAEVREAEEGPQRAPEVRGQGAGEVAWRQGLQFFVEEANGGLAGG